MADLDRKKMLEDEFASRFGTAIKPYAFCKTGNGKSPYLAGQWLVTYKPTVVEALLAVVNGSGFGLNPPPTPAVGEKSYPVGSVVDCQASEYYKDEGHLNDYINHRADLYETLGGVFAAINPATGLFDLNVTTNEGTTTSLTLNEGTSYKYTWLMSCIGYRPCLNKTESGTTFYPDLGTVEETSTPYMEDSYYLYGSNATYVATAGDGATFVNWVVFNPKATPTSYSYYYTNQTLVLPIQRNLRVRAYFKKGYDYDVSKQLIKDGYSNFVCSNLTAGVESALELCGFEPKNIPYHYSQVFDLSLPIRGGEYQLVRIKENAFAKVNASTGGWWRDLIFPETLAEIGSKAFKGNTTLQRIVFNSFPTIADDAFEGIAANQMSFCIPRDNAGWNAFMADSERFTPWRSVDAEIRMAWLEAHPGERHPLGLTVGYNQQWVRYTVEKIGSTVIVIR